MKAIDRITTQLLPEWLELFGRKNADYNLSDGFEPYRILGRRGQFAEVWRKIWKLKKTMWDGEALIFEGEREILMDMVGHCFLAIALLDEEEEARGKGAVVELAVTPVPTLPRFSCTAFCEQGHTYRFGCGFQPKQETAKFNGS